METGEVKITDFIRRFYEVKPWQGEYRKNSSTLKLCEVRYERYTFASMKVSSTFYDVHS